VTNCVIKSEGHMTLMKFAIVRFNSAPEEKRFDIGAEN
jgi:hypothetical protein